MTLHVAGLWRYPVKSLAGEPLDSAHLTASGPLGNGLAWDSPDALSLV